MSGSLEILAPGGSYESVVAAVRCGADAVYMGMKQFNARIKADNFDDSEIERAIAYCHSHGVKVHITMNTLVYDSELTAAAEQIRRLCTLGADGVIVQDLGLASLIRASAPDLPLHASTQMSVHTPSGVGFLGDRGYSRVVLAREMSREEIAEVRAATDTELEMFVHGALCMCVSGQCYMSSMLGTRSGNRGMCAQPCRLPFSAKGGTGYDLSLKDLSLAEGMDEVRALGVNSLKIEGRMKRPEYVAAAVSAVKSGLEGSLDRDTLTQLRSVFSRSGFTDGYFSGRRGRDMFGTRQKQDGLAATGTLLKGLAAKYDKEVPRIAVDFCLNVLEGERVSLSASAMGKSVFVSEEYIPEKAINKPLTKQGLRERISKCGGTQFYPREVEVCLDEGLIVPASVINSLRRSALEKLEKALEKVKAIPFTPPKLSFTPHRVKKEMKINLRVANVGQIPKNTKNVENIYLPLNTDEKTVENLRKRGINPVVEVPRGLFGKEKAVENLLMKAKSMGITDAYCGTVDGIALGKKAEMRIHTGFTVNVTNSLSIGFLEGLGVKAITLSPELLLTRCASLGGEVERGIIAYGRLPLMLTRNCPVKNGTDCGSCNSSSYLTDRMNKRFPVVCGYGCSEVLNSAPIYMADRLREIVGCDFITLYFTKESPEECESLLEDYRKGTAQRPENFTRGLYYRGLTENIK